MKVLGTAFLSLLLLLTGCTSGASAPTSTEHPPASHETSPTATRGTVEPSPAPSTAPSSRPHGSFELPGAVPRVTVRTGATSFHLRPWTYCYLTACVDGTPPSDLPDVGEARRLEIEFPLDGWTFEATFEPVGVDCPRRHTVPLERIGEHAFVLEPAGLADIYDVTLSGRGDGDLFVTFRWTTPHDGSMPVPEARLAVLADHDGAVDSYGVELWISGLRATPRSASAQITVTATNGRSLSFEAVRAKGCYGEGAVYWDEPDREGLRAAELGPRPFTYDVVVVLDGVRHRARAAWPADEIEGNEPSVELDFSPPLPAMP